MNWLFSVALHNAALVMLLAPLVWAVARMCRKPPVAHLLWLLVLAKLLTPPVVNFELWNWAAEPGPPAREQTAHLPALAPQTPVDSQIAAPEAPAVAANVELSSVTRDELDSISNGETRSPPMPAAAKSGGAGFSIAAAWIAIRPILMGIWVGSAAWIAVLAGIRIVRFQRMLAGTLPAGQRLQMVADELAKRLGLSRSVDVRMAASGIAPLVWCLARRATVVVPRCLLAALDEEQTAMVMAHELAHLRRGDHRVRILEALVSTVYWWHPLVWWARRELHAAEEQCCDAWVAWVYPDRGREYARSLLTAAELLSSPAPQAALASPFLNPLTLRARIEVVLRNRSQRSASRRAALGLALVAAIVIPVGARGAARSQEREAPGPTAAATTASETAQETAPVAQPKERGETRSKDSAKSTAATEKSAEETPLARELQAFQGMWNFGACESELWEAELDEIQKTWTWKVEGQEIKWIRWGKQVVKLSFTVDPSKTPSQIDFTFLDGPDKGKKCQGIYEFERKNLWVCLTEPGAKVARPEKMMFTGGVKRSLLLLHKRDAAEPNPTNGAKVPTTAAPPAQADAAPQPRAESSPFDGTFKIEEFGSEKWIASADEFHAWKWAFRGREATWTRPGHEPIRLAFTVDLTVWPRQIDFTILDGPDKGEKCQGIYFASRHEINICFQDPGAAVERPTNTAWKPGRRHTSVTLVPTRILPVAEELEALQGVWKFEIYYSDWWPARISNPPIRWSDWRWTVKGNEIGWTGMKGEDVKLSLTLDPTKSPRQIDMTFLDGPHKGKVLRGTYKFRPGDGCDICFADPDAGVDRPGVWSYSTNAGRTAVSIERLRPDPAGDSDASAAEAGDAGRGTEIDAAIGRLRRLGAFVREFHPRGDPEYWVQIISTGLGATSRDSAPNFDNAVMDDVETIARGVPLDLHLRRTSVTGAGLARLVSAGRIDALELGGPNVDEAMLKLLPKLPLRGQLALDSDLLTDTAIKPLSRCRDLTSVSLSGSLLTDKCLEQLTGLPKLKAVSLGKSFSRGAFDVLSRLKGLNSLDASALTPDLDDLRKFPNLKRLSLSGPACNDEAAETIADTFQSLEQAYLRRTSITNAGVEHLSRIKTLKVLTLDGAAIDDGVADSIRRMKQLTWLSVEDCAIGDDTLAALSECPGMWYVFLVHTPVTDQGVAHLVKLNKPLALYLAHCRSVTDASVESLARLPDSENLHISLENSSITEQGARKLQAALPHAQIGWGIPRVRLK